MESGKRAGNVEWPDLTNGSILAVCGQLKYLNSKLEWAIIIKIQSPLSENSYNRRNGGLACHHFEIKYIFMSIPRTADDVLNSEVIF